jgi:hypothetical protein
VFVLAIVGPVVTRFTGGPRPAIPSSPV